MRLQPAFALSALSALASASNGDYKHRTPEYYKQSTCAPTTTIVPHIATIVTVPTIIYTPSIVTVPSICATETVTSTTTTSTEWPFASDTATYSAYKPLPTDIDPFVAFQKTMASTENTTLVWWYEGLSSILAEGLPEIPGLKSQTLMAYRVQQLAPGSMRIDWSELVILGDFQSGDDASYYYNPLSGMNASVPNYYYDGPVTYHITKNGSEINLNITQAGATISKTSITPGLYNGMVSFTQVEEKVRNNSTLVSTLKFISSLEDIRNPNTTTAPAWGFYYAYFQGAVSSIFGYSNGTQGATHIIGNIDKARVEDPLYPVQWATFQRKFPEFFSNETGAVDPDWDSILSAAGMPV